MIDDGSLNTHGVVWGCGQWFMLWKGFTCNWR